MNDYPETDDRARGLQEVVRHQSSSMGMFGEITKQRDLADRQLQLLVAHQFPRNYQQCRTDIKGQCERTRLAWDSQYLFPRGGNVVTGPSIRLMEAVAQSWRHMVYGSRWLEQTSDHTTVEVYAWDLQTNLYVPDTFDVQHIRSTRGGGKRLSDPQEITMHVRNFSSRRLRGCIERLIPRDFTDFALEVCNQTLERTVDTTPNGIAKVLHAFGAFRVTEDQIGAFFAKLPRALKAPDIIRLRKIFVSLKEGMTRPDHWFQGAPRGGTAISDSADEAEWPDDAELDGEQTAASDQKDKPARQPPLPRQAAPSINSEAPRTTEPPPPPVTLAGQPERQFGEYLIDQVGEVVSPSPDGEGAPFASPDDWADAYLDLMDGASPEAAALLRENNADALANPEIASRIPDEAASSEPEVIEPAIVRGKPDWASWRARMTDFAAIASADANGALRWFDAHRAVIERAPMAQRAPVIAAINARLAALGAAAPDWLAAAVRKRAAAPAELPLAHASPSPEPAAPSVADRDLSWLETQANYIRALSPDLIPAYVTSVAYAATLQRIANERPDLADELGALRRMVKDRSA